MSYDSWLEEPYTRHSNLEADYERAVDEFLDKTVVIDSGPCEGETGVVTAIEVEYDDILLTVKIPEPDEPGTFYTEVVNSYFVTVLDKTT